MEGVRGVEQSLGQMDQAGRDLRTAEDLIQSVLASQPANRTALLRAAEIAQHRMVLAEAAGRNDEAVVYALQAAGR